MGKLAPCLLAVTLLLLAFTSCAHQKTYFGISHSDNQRPLYLPDELKLVIKLDKHLFELEEPIPVKFEIENVGKTNVFLAPILTMDTTFYLKHEDEQKGTPLHSKILIFEIIRKEDIVRIRPGSAFSFQRSIRKDLYSKPDRIGKYQLYAVYHSRTDNIGNVQVWAGEIKSNILEFQIR